MGGAMGVSALGELVVVQTLCVPALLMQHLV